MNSYLILAIIVALIAILVLIYFSAVTKLKNYKERMDAAESIIDTNLNKKLDLIISINTEVKKVTGKKDYLKDYVSIRDLIITNNEKDLKLDEAIKLINELTDDYEELNKDKEFVKKMNSLRLVEESLVAAKISFNQNALKSNQLIKTIPYNIVAKLSKCRIRSFYSTNKTDSDETF